MLIEDFKLNCNGRRCLRHTMFTANCKKEWKQGQCHKKWQAKIDKEDQERKDSIKKSNEDWSIREQQKEDGSYIPKEFPVDEVYEQFKKDVWLKYAGFYDGNLSDRTDWKAICMFWQCLSTEERKQCDLLNKQDYFLNKNIDIAHIIGKGELPKDKYDIENVVLIGRLWHSRLDTYKDPITNTSITKMERTEWFIRIMNNFKEEK